MISDALKKKIQDLSIPIEKKIEEYKTLAQFPLEEEVSFKHPSKDVGIHCREDGSLEMWAGAARIVLDAETGSVVVLGNHLISSTEDVDLITGEGSNFAINDFTLKDSWYKREVIFPRTKASLESKFLTGAPAEGQTLVSFNDVFSKDRLFIDPDFKSDLEEILSIED